MTVISHSAESFSIDGTSITTSSYTYSNWKPAKSDYTSVLYKVATLNATTIYFTVEGRNDAYDHSASLYSEIISAAQSKHKVYNVSGPYKEVRVGFRIDLTSTPNNVYTGILRSETK